MGWLSKGKRKAKFRVGDTIKCIDDRDHIVVFGREYVVLNVYQLTCCGDFCYDVGLGIGDNESYTNCGDCNTDVPGRGVRWAAERRFALLRRDEASAEEEEEEDTTEAQESLLKEAKEILEKEHSLN